MKQKSKGHICFRGSFEFFEGAGEVFRAHVSNVIDTTGRRSGRWECSIAHFERFRAVILGFDATEARTIAAVQSAS